MGWFGIRSRAQRGFVVPIISPFSVLRLFLCSSLVISFELYMVKYVLQTKQSVEAVNPLARLLKVEEMKSKDMVDHVLSVQPERYDDLRLREHEFLIVIQCQYAPFKVSSLCFFFSPLYSPCKSPFW